MQLNSEQYQAINILKGPLYILAGPGTGKTATITERICNLVENHNVPAEKILALTFTNKAAHELKERLQKRFHNQVEVKTFHSLAAKLLRCFWKENFTIEDQNDPETLSFDDLLSQFLKILENPQILEICQNLYLHIFVDEYQDVNAVQIEIIKKLSAKHQNICVVGDPDQSIYSWRGVNLNSLQDFLKFFPNTNFIILTQNYRNPKSILDAAQALISNNPDRPEKNLQALKTEGQNIQLWQSNNYFEQSEILIHLLEQKLGSISSMIEAHNFSNQEHNYNFSDIAIIYRTQRQGKKIASLLEKKGYPFKLSAPEYFWDKSYIKNFLTELEHLLKLKNFPQITFSEWLNGRIHDFLENTKLPSFAQDHLQLLLSIAINFNNQSIQEALQQFLDESKINQEADNLLNENKINLLTFHAAKGLQFPVVFIFGLEQGNMPYKTSLLSLELLAEERRLLYVGLTRASADLYLLTNRQAGQQSSFLKEIKPLQHSYLPVQKMERLKKRQLKRAQLQLF